MTGQWKQRWKQRLIPGTKGKTFFFLALTALVLLYMWSRAGYPLPTAELEFRRLERQNLLPRSEIVFATPEFHRSTLAVNSGDRTVNALDGTELTLNGKYLVGVTENQAVVAAVENVWRRQLSMVPLREDGMTLLPLEVSAAWSDSYGYWVEESVPPGGGYRYDYHNFAPLLVLDVPGDAARLEVAVEQNGAERLSTGWDLGGGVWLAGIEGEGYRTGWYLGQPYALRLYDSQGRLLLEQTGTVPEPVGQ